VSNYSNGINKVDASEVELIRFLVEHFKRKGHILAKQLPEDQRKVFWKLFERSSLTKKQFKTWLQQNPQLLRTIQLTNNLQDDRDVTQLKQKTPSLHEEINDRFFNEVFPQASPRVRIENKDTRVSPSSMGKNGEEILTMGKNGEEIYRWIIKAVERVIPLTRPYYHLAAAAMYLHKKPLTRDELLRVTAELNKSLNLGYAPKTLQNAVSKVLADDSITQKIEGRGITRYRLFDDIVNDITNALIEIVEEEKAKAELEAENAETIEGMAAKFFQFFKTYGVDTGSPVYIEKLRELLTVKGGRSLEVDYVHVNAFIPDVAERLISKPDDVIRAAEMAVREVLKEPELGFPDDNLPEVHVRFFNLPRSIAPRKVGSDHLNKFVQVEGVVSRITEVKPFVHRAVYVCRACGNEMVRIQNPYSVYMKRPEKCEACGSRDLYLDDEKSTFIDYQTIRVQDAPEVLRGGQMPRFLDVVLLDDLVDSVQPGDRVIITGVLRRVEEKTEKRPVVRKVLIANHVQPINRDLDEIELTREDEQRIREEAGKPYFKERLVRSIAPNIYGMERIKEGIALSLVGGIGERPDGTKMRDAIHVLLVGDPGKGKSALLEFLRRVAPRSILASAEGVTKAGFTAAAVRDELTGEWVLEAGVMVLADKGFALLDEFEKMKESDRNAIHRAMEQGTVEIHKAGINATLNARATVIAAANPVHNRWNFNEDIADQIKLPPTIISRFDLIFPVIDEPDPQEDKKLAESMLGLDREESSPATEPYDEEFLKKFIAYARRNVHPRLSREAAVLLGEYYVNLRRRAKREGGFFKIPITARQLEALIRLTTAHARLHLREIATVEDAKAAIGLLEYSLRQLLPPDQRDELDVNVIMVGRSTEGLAVEEEVIKAIKQLDNGDGAPDSAIISLLREKGIEEEKVRDVLDYLRERGDVTVIYSKGGVDFYRLTPK